MFIQKQNNFIAFIVICDLVDKPRASHKKASVATFASLINVATNNHFTLEDTQLILSPPPEAD